MKVVITGASGQDGIFLTDKILRETNAEVYACTRKKNNFDFKKLQYLKNQEDMSRVKIVELDYLNYDEIYNFLADVKPNFLYNLMGPSSVKSFIENPIKMTDETLNSFKNITNALINTNNFCNFYQSSSSEMYGYDSKTPFDEISEFKPNTPYAKAKLEIHNETLKFIEKYDWKIISGIMFNHESEFRTSNFLVMNLVETAIKIKNNNNLKLSIPSLEISRDWTYAQETCEGIFQLIENNYSGSFVVGSGVATNIKDICKYIFEKVDLDFEDFIDINPKSMRIGEPIHVQSNPKKIKDSIGWEAKRSIFDVIDKMFFYKNF